MRTLVLGGTRFIGLRLVHELLRRGHQLTILNRGQTAAELPPEVERLYADRADPESVKRALRNKEFDAVFDISGYTTQALQPAVEALEGRVGRYVFCSSIAVYKASETVPILETQPLAEDSEMVSTQQFGRYGMDKVACEEYLRDRWRSRGFAFTVLRPVMVYGPHNGAPLWEFSFFARLRRKRPILIPGDGSRIMQFVFVDDLAQAFASIPESGASLAQAYNRAGPEALTLVGYVNLLGRVVGVEPELIFVAPEVIDEGEGSSSFPFVWQRSAIYSIEKARSHLGFHPRPMATGLEEAYRWYLTEGLDDRDWDFSEEDKILDRLGHSSHAAQ